MSKRTKVVLLSGSSLLLAIAIVFIAVNRNECGPVTWLHRRSTVMLHAPTPTWTFAVSGDSRNCGDVVMPTIAADAATHAPQFYWHLGDFRFIAMVDEDMQCGPAHQQPRLEHEQHEWKDLQEFLAYEKREPNRVREWIAYEDHAWNDFMQYQVGAFDRSNVPVYLGIGNHEMILHHDHKDFIRTFKQKLNPVTQQFESGTINTYYHWMIGGVDFINLDNAGTAVREKDLSFGRCQLKWLQGQLASDAKNADVKSVVVGMHAALPNSISAAHSMNESSKEGKESGIQGYQALWDFQTQTHKHVYVLASHSHYYMEDIFNTEYWKGKGEVLPGWIVGTAGAHRNPLPSGPGGWKNSKDARANVYGYLLGTVNPDGQSEGEIKFEFHEVKQDSVPSDVAARFHPGLVAWCFQRNTDCVNPDQHCETPQPGYGYQDYRAAIAPLHCE
jgi:hypothetical protein